VIPCVELAHQLDAPPITTDRLARATPLADPIILCRR
jgi:hypothetical protein